MLNQHRLWVRTDSRVLWGMLTNQNHGHPEVPFPSATVPTTPASD